MPKDVQIETFQRQVRLAVEAQLPMIIHVREAWDEAFAIINEEGASEIGGVIHGFSGDAVIANQFIDVGFRISIGERKILSQENITLQKVVREIPQDQLLLDTQITRPMLGL